jgi:molybdate/tungstate transport system substrate-binding protein
MMKAAALGLLAMTLAVVPTSGASVSVAYAGSLVTTMEGPLAQTLAAKTGMVFAGEGKGSTELANLIRDGLRAPDVFITADPKTLDGLPVLSAVTFGSARMVVGYSAKSQYHVLFEEAAAGKRSILSVLAMPEIRLGRTDPQLDPKGKRTLTAVHLLAAHFHRPQDERAILERAQTFPEQDLLVRVETGELDAGFFYSTETSAKQLPVVELPEAANLSSQITYTLAIMKNAPHPRAARTFADFVLTGAGKPILEGAGVRYFAPLHSRP